MVDGSIRIDTKIDQSGVDKGLAGIEKSCSSFSMSMSSAFALAAAAGSALVTGALFSLNKSMLETASNANEMASRFASTFPDSIDAANTAVQELTTSYGFSTLAAQSSLSATGGLLATLGMTEKESLAASRGVAVLGADLASYTNYSGGAAGAADALTRALLGETEAAKGLSLSIGDDALAAYGRSLGKSVASMNTAEKAQLRLNLAFSQASAMGAVGDMIKTANGYANTIRAVTAKLEDAEARAGEKLIPVVSDLAREFGNAVSPGGAFAGMLDTVAEAGAQTTGVLTVLLAGLNSAARASSQVSGRKELQIQELMLGAVEARIAAEGGLAAVQARAVKDAGAAQTIKEYNTFTDSVKNLKAELKDLDAQEKAAKRGEVMQSAAMYQEKLLEAQRRMAEAQALLTRTDIPEMGREAAQKTYDQNLADYKLYWAKLSEMLQREGVSVAEAYAAATPTVKKTVLPPTGAGADEKTAANLHALWQEYYNWKVGEEEGSLAQEIQLSEAAYKKKIADAQLSYEDLEVIADMHESEIAKIREKWAKKHEIASFLMGFGMSEQMATGMESGVFSIVSATKDIGEAIADTFDVIGNIFDFGASVLGWIVDFNYADTESAITKYITAIGDFFKNKLGAMPVLFDVGAAAVEQLLAGLMASLPAIVASIGNLVQHIADYIINNGPALISSAMTVLFAIVEALVKKAPELFRAVLVAVIAFIEDLAANASTFTSFVAAAISSIIQTFMDKLPVLVQAVVSLAVNLFEALVKNLPQILQSLVAAIPVVIQSIVAALPMIVNALAEAIPQIIIMLIDIIPDVITALVKSLPDLIVAALLYGFPLALAIRIGWALLKAVPQIVKSLGVAIARIFTETVPQLFVSIGRTFTLFFSQLDKLFFKDMSRVGGNMMKGLVEGMKKAGNIWPEIKKIFTGFVDAVKNFFGIHSPSTLFASIGWDIIQGLIVGLFSLSANLAASIVSVMTSCFSAAYSVLTQVPAIGSAIIDGIVSGVSSVGGGVWDALKACLTFDFSGVLSTVYNFGGELITTLASGVTSMWSALTDLFSFDVDGLAGSISSIGSTIVDAIKSGITAPINLFIDQINAVIRALNKIHVKLPKWLGGYSFGIDLPYIDKLATGTKNARGGWTVVGENGPEMVNMKSGATVLNASDSIRAVMAGLTPRTAGAGAAQSINISGDISAADVVIDGNTVGRIAFKYIDRQVKAAYGA